MTDLLPLIEQALQLDLLALPVLCDALQEQGDDRFRSLNWSIGMLLSGVSEAERLPSNADIRTAQVAWDADDEDISPRPRGDGIRTREGKLTHVRDAFINNINALFWRELWADRLGQRLALVSKLLTRLDDMQEEESKETNEQ